MTVALKKKNIGRVLETVEPRNNFGGDILAQALWETVAPVVNALDAMPEIRQTESADNGHEKASVIDAGLKYELSNMLQNLWRQNYGVITIQKKNAQGKVITTTTIPNGDQRLKDSEARIADMSDISSPDDFSTFYWFKVNEARYDMRNNFIASLASVYREIYNEDWKPMTPAASMNGPVKTTAAIDIPEEEKNRMLAQLAAVKARTQNRT